MALLSPKYYGSVFNVVLHESKSRLCTGRRGYLFTSQDSVVILSENWKESLFSIKNVTIENVDKVGKDIAIKYRVENQFKYVLLESEKNEKLFLALTSDKKESAINKYATNNKIIPSMKILRSDIEIFYDRIGAYVIKFYAPFNFGKIARVQLTDMFVCAYRFKFLNHNNSEDFDGNCSKLLTDLRRTFFIQWINAAIKASKFHIDENAFEYFVRILCQIVDDLFANQECIETNISDFAKAVAVFAQTGDATGIPVAAEKIKSDVEALIDQNYSTNPPINVGVLDLIYKAILVAFCGNMIDVYNLDIDKLMHSVVEFTEKTYFGGQDLNFLRRLRGDMEEFTIELLRLCDSKRYDPEFHFVFVSFCILDSIKDSGISKETQN